MCFVERLRSLFNFSFTELCQQNKINKRQRKLVDLIISKDSIEIENLRKLTSYQELYANMSDKTKSRDIEKLISFDLIIKINNVLYPGFHKHK